MRHSGWMSWGVLASMMVAVGCDPAPVTSDAGLVDSGATGMDGGIDAAVTDPDAGPAPADARPPSGDAGPPSGDASAGRPGALGEACSVGTDCASGHCFPSGFAMGVCTERCAAAGDCPAGWDCGSFGADMVCRCEARAETCNAGDDDCDGAVDEGRPEAIGCGEGETCEAGTCGCPAARMCGARCVDIETDPEHCGACGDACALDAVCLGARCCTPAAETCNGADDDCDGAVDEGSGAAVGCADMQACVDGRCACPSMCGARCVDLDRDANHCGACGSACATGLDCVEGACCEASGTRVDVLFMVDNSNSMSEEQAALAEQLPRMVRVLATGDLDGDGTPESDPVRDLHLGVITPDMGTGGHTVPTCARSDFGDDGILRTQGRTDIGGCMATYPTFLEFRPGPGADPDAAAAEFACVAAAGTGGCGFEQQLEAVLKAVTRSAAPIRFFRDTTGHADLENAGFLRDDSVLVTLLLTDENDCSAADPGLFDPGSATYTEDLNLRCFAYPSALHTLTRYRDGLLATRSDPRDLIFAAVAGIPADLVSSGTRPDYARILSDSRMIEEREPAMPNRIRASCNTPGVGVAFPPRRFVRLAQELEDRGATAVLGSICQASFADPMSDVLARIVQRLGESCAAP